MGRKGKKRDRDSHSDAERSHLSESSQDQKLSQSDRQRERSTSKARKTDICGSKDNQLKISDFTVSETAADINRREKESQDSSEMSVQGTGGMSEVIRRIGGLEDCVRNGNHVLVEKLEALAGQIFDLQIENKELKSRVIKLEEKQKDFSEEIFMLRKQVADGREKINDIEQQGRKENLRFFGIDGDNPKENIKDCERKVLNIIQQKLGLSHINEKDISIAHRTGKPTKGKNRAVIVKFVLRKTRNEILYNRKKLKGSGISIQEDLTKINAVRLDRLSKHEEVKQAWSKNGKLYVSLKLNGRVLQIAEGENELEACLSSGTEASEGPRYAYRQQHFRHDPRRGGQTAATSNEAVASPSVVTVNGQPPVSLPSPLRRVVRSSSPFIPSTPKQPPPTQLSSSGSPEVAVAHSFLTTARPVTSSPVTSSVQRPATSPRRTTTAEAVSQCQTPGTTPAVRTTPDDIIDADVSLLPASEWQ